MDEREIRERIHAGKEFIRTWERPGDEEYQSDQDKRLPQPPLAKAAMTDHALELPKNFEQLELKKDVVELFYSRKSSRVYTREQLSLQQLSWLLWATQGVKSIRGKSYATLRTVPCGGARHEFECYMMLQNVETLEDGLYHYLPMTHQIELLRTKAEVEQAEGKCWEELIGDCLMGQQWAEHSNVVFVYSMVAYRAEWRYGIHAHRVALIDAGHITENLYLACAAANLGTCAIGAVDTGLCDRLFGLDGEEEFSFYAATLGTISEQNVQKEKDFYAFLKEQDL